MGGKLQHGVGDFANDGEHGLFELGFVDGFALVEPIAVVMFLQPAEEFEGFWAKVGGSSSWGFHLGSHGNKECNAREGVSFGRATPDLRDPD